jgi:drug/metabolite transporter (DMT)-like permease
MIEKYKNYILLHITVFIWGFTAILGKIITLSEAPLVWWRLLISSLVLYFYLRFSKVDFRVSRKTLFHLFIVGGIIAMHWIFFYRAVKVSTIAVTLGCFSCGSLFSSFLEPVFFKNKINKVEIFCGILVILGLWLIFSVESKYLEGILCSVSAAFLSALFTVLNAKLVRKERAEVITFYEFISGLLVITIYLLLNGQLNASLFSVSSTNWFWLIVFSIICTVIPFIISIGIMKEIRPYTVTLSVNLEPIYGILFAYFIFGDSEKMTMGFYAGTLIILSTIFLNAYLRSRSVEK